VKRRQAAAPYAKALLELAKEGAEAELVGRGRTDHLNVIAEKYQKRLDDDLGRSARAMPKAQVQ
jgi:F0F1-type ATP synthase delta subunit